MSENNRIKRKRPGSPPGVLVHVGRKKMQSVDIQAFDFGRDNLEEAHGITADEALKYRDTQNVSWVNIDGLHDVDIIRTIGSHYHIHALNLEDVLDTNHRPKIDDMEDYIYVSLKMLTINPADRRVALEHISILLGETWVLSFQEIPGDIFEPIRERLRAGKGRMRKMGADYFAYALMDSIVDHYFVVVEELGARIEILDEAILQRPSPKTLQEIHSLKNELITVRKSVWPMRDIVAGLARNEGKLIRPETEVFIKDLYDHVIQLIDTVEIYRDLVGGLFDIYLSSISNRTNEIIRVLTVTTSIFIPLTFIVGVYGMNFHYFPELEWKYGYPMIWLVMLSMAGGMLILFRKRGWI